MSDDPSPWPFDMVTAARFTDWVPNHHCHRSRPDRAFQVVFWTLLGIDVAADLFRWWRRAQIRQAEEDILRARLSAPAMALRASMLPDDQLRKMAVLNETLPEFFADITRRMKSRPERGPRP